MTAKERMGTAVESARPYVERLAQDEELHEHVKKAYESAQKIYSELASGSSRSSAARRFAADSDLQDEVRRAVQELRRAGERARGREASHKARNTTLLLIGITLGVLFNPATGPETRRWLKDKLFGAEEPFEYSTSTNGEDRT
jgi:hypothetical protein